MVGFIGLVAGLLAQQLIVLLAGVPLFVGGVILHAPKLRELREQRRSEREHKQIERRSVAHPRTASALGLILSIPLGIAFFELARWLMTP